MERIAMNHLDWPRVSDIELLQACQRGEESAWLELWRRYHRGMLARARSWGYSPEDAESLVQETFFRLYRKVGQFRARKAREATGWIFCVLKSVLTDDWRARRACREFSAGLTPGIYRPVAPDTLERLIRQEDAERIQQAVYEALKQTPRLYQAFWEYVGREGRSMREVAAQVGMKENTFRVYVRRAQHLLRQRL